MKLSVKSLLGAACVTVGLLSLQSTASAIPISGKIDMSGGATTDTGDLATAHAFTSFTGVETGINTTGSYAGIAYNTPVVMNAFTFNPAGTVDISPLWSLVFGGKTYSFDLTKVTAFHYDSSTLALSVYGVGTADITGFTPTTGDYLFTTQGGPGSPAANFEFSATTTVPDSGTTVALLGLSLIAVEGTRRVLSAKRAVKA